MGCCSAKTKEEVIHEFSTEKPNKRGKNNGPRLSLAPKNWVIDGGKITEKYKIHETLGSGGFGQVKRCTFIKTNEVRAVKIIKKSACKNISELHNEIHVLKNLDHPNILKIYQFFEDNVNYYIVTEYCSGGELFEKIMELIDKKEFDENLAADIMKQLLSAMVYCHNQKIVHRDLKPENLLLERSDARNIKVIDFGTSKLFDKDHKMVQKFGTPYYIAPEVLRKNYDEKCDIWSCGVILYILLVGFPPFSGKTDQDILNKVQRGIYSIDSKDWKKVSKEAKELVSKMLTYDPTKRISAATALADVWFTTAGSKNTVGKDQQLDILGNMRQFRAEQKLQQTVLSYFAAQLFNKEREEELKKIFISFDTNGDGQLDKEELIDGYEKVFNDRKLAEDEVDRIIEEIDIDGNGVIDYTEFLMANIKKEELFSKNKLKAAFDMFDLDGNGSISLEEIKQVLGSAVHAGDDAFWKDLINEVDADGNGEIDFEEFTTMMKNFYAAPIQ